MNRKLRKWSVNDLQDAVAKSKSYSDVLRNLGLGVAGGNAKTLKKYIRQFEIDVSHFCSNEMRNKSLEHHRENIRYTPEQVFVENWNGSPNTTKRLASKHIPKICSECSLGEIWNGRKIVLQLDHINGIKQDCRKDNLRWLCPNCHSQTPTFAGRKSWKEGTVDTTNKCVDCLCKIYRTSVRCKGCENRRKKILIRS